MNDGASVRRRRERGVRAAPRASEVLATIVSQGYVADEFAYLARTPAKAGAIALEKAGKTIDDVGAGRDERGVLVGRAQLG